MLGHSRSHLQKQKTFSSLEHSKIVACRFMLLWHNQGVSSKVLPKNWAALTPRNLCNLDTRSSNEHFTLKNIGSHKKYWKWYSLKSFESEWFYTIWYWNLSILNDFPKFDHQVYKQKSVEGLTWFATYSFSITPFILLKLFS